MQSFVVKITGFHISYLSSHRHRETTTHCDKTHPILSKKKSVLIKILILNFGHLSVKVPLEPSKSSISTYPKKARRGANVEKGKVILE